MSRKQPVTFEEPPPIQRGPRRRFISAREAELIEQAAALKARPGEWARLSVHLSTQTAAQHAHRINDGISSAFRPAGAFEAVSRTVNGEYRVYARYVAAANGGDVK